MSKLSTEQKALRVIGARLVRQAGVKRLYAVLQDGTVVMYKAVGLSPVK